MISKVEYNWWTKKSADYKIYKKNLAKVKEDKVNRSSDFRFRSKLFLMYFSELEVFRLHILIYILSSEKLLDNG